VQQRDEKYLIYYYYYFFTWRCQFSPPTEKHQCLLERAAHVNKLKALDDYNVFNFSKSGLLNNQPFFLAAFRFDERFQLAVNSLSPH
jgi:hypothetical protein